MKDKLQHAFGQVHADPARVFLMRTDQAPLAERISLCCEPSR